MSWDGVFQMKFDGQFDADGAANGAGWDVYLDNIYFWNDGTGSGPPQMTPMMSLSMSTLPTLRWARTACTSVVETTSETLKAMPCPTADEDGTWTVTVAVPARVHWQLCVPQQPERQWWRLGRKRKPGRSSMRRRSSSATACWPAVNADTTLSTCFRASARPMVHVRHSCHDLRGNIPSGHGRFDFGLER